MCFGNIFRENQDCLEEQLLTPVVIVTILLHDLGWDMSPDSPWTTMENRFEVDSANGARAFVQSHPAGKKWSKAKVQQMWDAIALQGAYGIASHKEPLVWGSIQGIAVDYRGAGVFGINQTIVDQVVAEFPNDDLLTGTNETFKWFCETKPETTYGRFFSPCLPPLSSRAVSYYDVLTTFPLVTDTWVEGWGTYFVPGYDATGHRQVDQFRTVF